MRTAVCNRDVEIVSVLARAIGRAKARAGSRSGARRTGPIGVDFALDEVHFVQLQRDIDGAPRVRARASIGYDVSRIEALASVAQLKSILKKAFAAGGFAGRDAVLAMPSGMFRTMSINYKAGGGPKQEAAAVAGVMAKRLKGSLNDYIVDYLPVRARSSSDDRLALVAVSDRSPVLNFLEVTRKAGLAVQALEIGPVAIGRLVGSLAGSPDSKNILVVNSGRRASYLTLLSGDDLLFDQKVSIGEDHLIAQVATALEMPAESARDLVIRTGVHPDSFAGAVGDAINASGAYYTLAEILKPEFMKLVEEIKRAFLYAAAETRGSTVSQVYLLGSIARWPGADRLLGNLADVEVARVLDPLAEFGSPNETQSSAGTQPAPEIAVATGLALRGMCDVA